MSESHFGQLESVNNDQGCREASAIDFESKVAGGTCQKAIASCLLPAAAAIPTLKDGCHAHINDQIMLLHMATCDCVWHEQHMCTGRVIAMGSCCLRALISFRVFCRRLR